MKTGHEKNQNEIKDNLIEQFQQLQQDENSVPEELKNEVFNTIDTLEFIGDLADLFTGRFTQTKAELIGLVTEDTSTTAHEDETQQDDNDFWVD